MSGVLCETCGHALVPRCGCGARQTPTGVCSANAMHAQDGRRVACYCRTGRTLFPTQREYEDALRYAREKSKEYWRTLTLEQINAEIAAARRKEEEGLDK